MNDHELEATLRSVHADPTRYADAESVVRDVMSYPFHETPQRRRSLRPFTGTFQSMFSAAKFVVAGAIAALFGGFLLIVQPFDQQGASVPGATTDTATQAVEPASVVTGHVDADFGTEGPAYSYGENLGLPGDGMEGGRVRDVDSADHFLGRVEMDDERLSGDFSLVMNIDDWGEEGCLSGSEACCPDCPFLAWGSVLIENDGGAWEGTWSKALVLLDEPGPATIKRDVGPVVMRLVGTRGYEGLSAILYGTGQPNGGYPPTQAMQGLVFPGNLPPDREVATGTG